MNGTEVVASTGDPAFAVDRSGKMLAWNKAAEHCLGYRSSEVIGRPCWEVLRGLDLFSNRYCGKTCAVREMALRGEPVNRTQVVCRTGSGEERRFNMFTFVVNGETDKEIVHLLQRVSSCDEESAFPLPEAPACKQSRLSLRQLEVLKQLCDGKSTMAIAEHLGISPSTVRHHIQEIMRRLKVHSRLEVVALAHRLGLI